jgi:hypothetical protein
MAQPRTQTNNPLQAQPRKLPEDISHKAGPGTYRRFADTVGPAVVTPQVNRSAQSDRAKALEAGSLPIHGIADNGRLVSRDGLTQDQDELYGRT